VAPEGFVGPADDPILRVEDDRTAPPSVYVGRISEMPNMFREVVGLPLVEEDEPA
jgi:hypothetical protein